MDTQKISNLERMVYNWLVSHKIAFDFQSQVIGGFGRQLGDAIADFVLTEQNIILRVQGGYWHKQTVKKASDEAQKLTLSGMGYTVVDLWEGDITTQLDTTMKNALLGQEIG